MLGRLSVGRKLMLIYLLDLTAVIYVSGILIDEKFIGINFARKEISGNAYVEGVRDSLIDIGLLGAGDADAVRRFSAQMKLLAHTEATLGADMLSADLNAALIKTASRMTGGNSPALEGTAAALGAGRELITRVGNQSNLILDPDLDSYYTMSLIVVRFPELLELVNSIGALLATQPHDGLPSVDMRTNYLILEGRLDSIAQGIRSDNEEAQAAGGSALKAALEPSQLRLQSAIDKFRQQTRGFMEAGGTATAEASMRDAQVTLIRDLQTAWTSASNALDVLLDKRIDGFFQRMWLHLGTALALLFVILTIVTFVARQIARPLRHLATVADEVRVTGDHTRRAQWHSSDEIGRLVFGFNSMLAQLDNERETQKELAASARAADAQRALVEATPIPLVVTAIPTHEVLHANQPAETWLHGSLSDPWKTGLDSAVRARFFQELSDRGAVDEFEVNWLGNREPAWAVLSARRVHYQGHDAILTSFTPITHLKLMERRLQLWAKVFEASSEGILIVDAQQRILTANQAFSDLTGYHLQEIIGEKPALVLDVGDSGISPDSIWPAVEARSTWQGELHMRRRNGTDYPAWLMVNVVRQSQGEISHYIFTSIDITDRKKSEQRIRFLAEHDVLTELPNRSLCTERLRLAVQHAQRSGQLVAVLLIDLDHFKDINDSLGHHIGDGLLRSVATRLVESVRVCDTVSRLGGDEFVIVLNGVNDIEEVSLIIDQRLIPKIRQAHNIDGAELRVSCSIGVAICPHDATDIDELMRLADTAMYQAKADGKDNVQFFTAEMTARTQARIRLDADLRHALELKQFELHYQPRIDAQSGALLGVEALLRWQHPEMGMVSPVNFIPRAEEIGLIVPLGAWVIEEACRQVAQWRDQGWPMFGVSINLSARQLRSDDLLEHVRSTMARYGIGHGVLEMELTESLVMDDAAGNLRKMHALRDLGVSLSIDDFGTGYSSLAYLNRLPIDKLKIDRSFVQDMLADPIDRAITMAVISLGHTLGLKVVAEGVELEGQAALLREAHCDELQGYLFARPMRAEDLAQWSLQRQLHAA